MHTETLFRLEMDTTGHSVGEPKSILTGLVAGRLALVSPSGKAIGKDVIAAFSTDPAILGGTIVKIGDQVYDGSVRKRLGRLRRQLLAGS